MTDTASDSLFVLHDNASRVTEVRSHLYESEEALQLLLASHPELLTSRTSGATTPRRWILVSREQGIPDAAGADNRWALFLDQDGVPTLVEVKRATDTRARREVVAQMLDYAANAVAHWPIADLRASLESTCRDRGQDPEKELRALTEDADPDVDAFWSGVESNLRSGRLRLLFVADTISPELLRIVEFLNDQMRSATVLAIQIRQFVTEGVRVLSPVVLGDTSRARGTKERRRGSAPADRGRLLGRYAEENGGEAHAQLLKVVRWLRGQADRVNITDQQGSYYVEVNDASGVPRRPLAVDRWGKVVLNLGDLKPLARFASEESRREVLEHFKSKGLTFTSENVQGSWLFTRVRETSQGARSQG